MKEELKTIDDLYWVADEALKYDLMSLANRHARMHNRKDAEDARAWWANRYERIQSVHKEMIELAEQYKLFAPHE